MVTQLFEDCRGHNFRPIVSMLSLLGSFCWAQILATKTGHTKPPVSLIGQLFWREFFYTVGYATVNYDRCPVSDRLSSFPHFISWIDLAKSREGHDQNSADLGAAIIGGASMLFNEVRQLESEAGLFVERSSMICYTGPDQGSAGTGGLSEFC